MPKALYESLYKGLTGKKPATTAKSRQENIERQMEGLPPKNENTKAKVNRRGYSVHKMDDV